MCCFYYIRWTRNVTWRSAWRAGALFSLLGARGNASVWEKSVGCKWQHRDRTDITSLNSTMSQQSHSHMNGGRPLTHEKNGSHSEIMEEMTNGWFWWHIASGSTLFYSERQKNPLDGKCIQGKLTLAMISKGNKAKIVKNCESVLKARKKTLHTYTDTHIVSNFHMKAEISEEPWVKKGKHTVWLSDCHDCWSVWLLAGLNYW